MRLALLVSLIVVCVGMPTARASAQATDRPTRVLVLYGLAPDSPTAPELIERLRTTVRSELPPPVEFYVEYLDLDRFPDPRQPERLTRYLANKYEGFHVDVVVAVGAVALQFATERLRDRLPGVPVVFGLAWSYGVNTRTLPSNVTGRLLSLSLGRTVTMARRLQPDLERLYVIAGASRVDSLALADALTSLGPMRDSVRVVVRQGLPFDELRAELRRLPPHSAVFPAYFRQDGRGEIFVPVEALETIARDSRVPTYGFADPLLERGLLGGAMFQHNEEGKRLGALVVRVLRTPPGVPLPPVTMTETPYVVDWRVLRRFGLDERRLPPGTEVRSRVLSPWERYRSEILLGLGIIAAQAMLIGALLVERRARRHAQLALREQSAYERTLAELTTDAARHAPEDAPRALEDALARVAKYAGADSAMLVQYAEGTSQPASRSYWMRRPDGGGATPPAPAGDGTAITLELPLVVAGTPVGALELYRMPPGPEWPASLAARLSAAAEVIASAIARSRAAAAAEEAQRQIAHLGRVAVIGELGSTISHELRQPLTAISVNAESGMRLLGGPHPDLDEMRAVLADVVADARRASEMIEEIRLMLRKQGRDATAVDLNEVVQHAAALLQRAAGTRGARLDLALQPDLPRVYGNVIELRQVVLNLTLNALDAVATATGVRAVVIGTTARGSSVELYVRDTGPGLSPEVERRLFDPFFTTKPHGLGMGLPIVHSLVLQHGGHVAGKNRAEGGAIFRVVLPAAAAVAEGASAAGHATAAAS